MNRLVSRSSRRLRLRIAAAAESDEASHGLNYPPEGRRFKSRRSNLEGKPRCPNDRFRAFNQHFGDLRLGKEIPLRGGLRYTAEINARSPAPA
jgi:hypothetical protein